MSERPKPRFSFGDTETDGLAESVEECVAEGRQVIEYAFVIWEDGERKDSIVRKVMPTGDAITRAEECAAKGWNHFERTSWMNPTGQPREYSAALPWSEHDCENVDRFLAGETLAGSNPRFDLTVLKGQFYQFGDKFPELATHRMLDVGALAWPLWTVGLTEKTGLAPLAKLLGVEHKAHTAMGDVEACIACFEILIDSYIYRPRQQAELLHELGKEKGIDAAIIDREIGKLRGVAL